MADGDQQGDGSCCVIIPARFDSSRFPGKPLARLRGAGGVERSLIEWSWRAAREVPQADVVVVATDDRRIADEVERFGGRVAMTPRECANGTERCAAALHELPMAPEIVVNFQGDAPLTPPAIVAAVIDRLRDQPETAVATPAIRCTAETYRHLVADHEAGRVGGTTLVFDRRHRALYFSKSIIPFIPSARNEQPFVHLHLGIYGYRADALADYTAADSSVLERLEGLEQLRFLDMAVPVSAVLCEPPEGLMIELNNPSDVPLIEAELQRRGR